MGRVPVRIVPPVGNGVSGGVVDIQFGPGGIALDVDIGLSNISGGVLPITQALYDLATATNSLLLEDDTNILLEDSSLLLMEQ